MFLCIIFGLIFLALAVFAVIRINNGHTVGVKGDQGHMN